MDLINAIKSAKVGEIDEIKRLIENGSDINYIHNRMTPLSVACKYDRLDIVKILYKAGAKYQENELSNATLVYASYYGYVNIVKYLIKKYTISDRQINNSIYCAVYENNIDVLDYLLTLEYNLDFVPNNPLLQACDNENIDAIDRLLNAGANVNIDRLLNPRGNMKYWIEPLISRMVRYNRLDIIKRLVMFGGDINTYDRYNNQTPIIEACIRNYTEIAEFLIEMGCDINFPSDALKTPLMFACRNNNLEIVKLLIKYKADIDFIDNDGRKAIDYTKNDEIKVYLAKN